MYRHMCFCCCYWSLLILAEQQYRIGLTSYYYNYFTDPSVKNAQVPIFSPNNSLGYVKYWWFG